VLAVAHVDEVDDDQPAEVAQGSCRATSSAASRFGAVAVGSTLTAGHFLPL